MKGVKSILLIGLIGSAFHLNAQSLTPQVIANAGMVSNSESISLSWTLGLSFASSVYYSDGMLTEGFHQPLLNVSPINNTLVSNDIEIQAFPNPVQGVLSVKLKNNPEDKLSIELIDLLGRKIISRSASSEVSEFEIQMQHLPASIYILQVNDSKGVPIQTHKISKNN